MKKVSIWYFLEYSFSFQLFLTDGLMDWGVSLHLIALGDFFSCDIVLLVLSLPKLLALVTLSSNKFYTVGSNRGDKGRWFISSDTSSLNKLLFLDRPLGFLSRRLAPQFYCYSLCSKYTHTLTHHFLLDYAHKTCHVLVASIQFQSALSVQIFLCQIASLGLSAAGWIFLGSWRRNEPASGPALLETRLCHYGSKPIASFPLQNSLWEQTDWKWNLLFII